MRRPHLTLRRHLVHDPSQAPAELLGPNHPLVRGEEIRGDLWRQSLATSLVVLVGTIATASRRGWGIPLLVASLLVQLGLAVALALLAQLQRERAREVIIAGRSDLALPVLELARRRLQRLRRRHRLARALEELARTAERWPPLVPGARPIFDPCQIRAASGELRAIAARLRDGTIPVAGVARIERLLTSGDSPLYGREPEALGQELRRIRIELDEYMVASRPTRTATRKLGRRR
jgi:hypothetical protein